MTRPFSGTYRPAKASPPRPRRYLALNLPWLPAERLIRGGHAPADRPFALIEKQRGAMRVTALSPRAAALGLRCAMTLADARGQVPELAAFAFDPAADRELLGRMARHCLAWSPSVTADPPDGILLDIAGCEHLSGGEARLRDEIAARFRHRGFTVRLAAATTPDAARALARFGADTVEALPLLALEVEEDVLVALRRAGFRSIGDLAAAPAATLGNRFGKRLPRLLDRLLGREDPHITPSVPEAAIVAELRFAEPIGRHDDVLDAIESLVARSAVELAGRGQGGRAFALRLHRSDGHIARLEIETGAPTRDGEVLLRLFAERIDSLADPLDPGFGYDSIDLRVVRAEALEIAQQGLAPETARRSDTGPLLDRLAVRYGPATVMRFAPGNSHLPERAARLAALRDAAFAAPWLVVEAGEPPLRPLFLFDPPQQVEVLAALPDAPPRRFRWRGRQHLVRRFEGPERIAAEWWNRRGGHDERPGFTRDYYRVEDAAGHRFWLFRHGLYGRESDAPCWYIHGLFA